MWTAMESSPKYKASTKMNILMMMIIMMKRIDIMNSEPI
jgi:hypothetical protein